MGLLILLLLVAAAIAALAMWIRSMWARGRNRAVVAPDAMTATFPTAALPPSMGEPPAQRRIRGRRRLFATAWLALFFTLLPWADGPGYKLQLVAVPLVMLPWAYPVRRAQEGRPMRRSLALFCCAVALLWALILLVLGIGVAASAHEPTLLVAGLCTLACALAFQYSVGLYVRDQPR